MSTDLITHPWIGIWQDVEFGSAKRPEEILMANSPLRIARFTRAIVEGGDKVALA